MINMLLAVLLISGNAFTQERIENFTFTAQKFTREKIGNFEFAATRENHKARVTFTVDKFDPSLHKVVELDHCGSAEDVRIDGRIPLGTDCTMPIYEIKAMTLEYDGLKIDIPNELYSDCYDPPFSRSRSDISDYFAIKIGDDLRSVFVFMGGGDGAGHYEVIWVLRPDGKHSRFSTGPCPDCSFINFASGFDER